MADLESRVLGTYLGLAVGDALGATVEFMTPREIKAEFGEHRRIAGGGWLKLKAGQVTDDTEMSLALGDAILAAEGVTAMACAEAFSAWMSRKPVDIGNTVRRGIVNYRRSGHPAVPENEHDAGNGACMRALPVALSTWGMTEHEVRTACRIQSHVTHHNRLSDAGTECVVLMVQRALDGAGKYELLTSEAARLVEAHPEFRFRGRREENPSGYIVHTLRAVFQALFDTDDFESSLVDVVNRGGDADTTGAIAGMLAGALYGVEAVPNRWLSRLDRSVRRQCETQALALIRRAPAFHGHECAPVFAAG